MKITLDKEKQYTGSNNLSVGEAKRSWQEVQWFTMQLWSLITQTKCSLETGINLPTLFFVLFFLRRI